MSTSDRLQKKFEVGDIVNIPIVVTGIGGTAANPTVTGTTHYAGFDGVKDEVTTVDSIQVVYTEDTPRS